MKETASGIWHHVVSLKYTDVSEMRTASIRLMTDNGGSMHL
jgi:hypothetical protein